MLENIDTNIWSVTHSFKVNGLPISSRMVVIRLPGGQLVLHSPVPISEALKSALGALGPVAAIIAPNKMHHLFLRDGMNSFPNAKAFAAPGLLGKLPSISGLQALDDTALHQWAPCLEGLLIEGMPAVNETVWFHRPSGSLIVTDVLQWWRGDVPWSAAVWARLVGVRHSIAVPRHAKWLVKDSVAARSSVQRVLSWPFQRVVMPHNSVLDIDAYPITQAALRVI